jgi:hypothetical protein
MPVKPKVERDFSSNARGDVVCHFHPGHDDDEESFSRKRKGKEAITPVNRVSNLTLALRPRPVSESNDTEFGNLFEGFHVVKKRRASSVTESTALAVEFEIPESISPTISDEDYEILPKVQPVETASESDASTFVDVEAEIQLAHVILPIRNRQDIDAVGPAPAPDADASDSEDSEWSAV